MPIPMSASQVLDGEFLTMRAKILELAASLDRLERAAGAIADDRRLVLIHQAIDVLKDSTGDRAEQVQLLFSREYEDDWQTTYGINPPR